jgi:hypothetical protein
MISKTVARSLPEYMDESFTADCNPFNYIFRVRENQHGTIVLQKVVHLNFFPLTFVDSA